jgi:hypothetical protein
VAFQNYADVEAALKAESDVWSRGQGHTDDAVRQNALAAREWWANYQAPKPQPPSPSSPSSPPPPPPKPPDPWITRATYTAPSGTKQADPDIIILADRPISPEFLLELLYEDIAGVELINISRSDIIDGQQVSYSPIKQLSSLRRRYNPNNIIALPELSSSFFSRFQIEILFRGINLPYFDEQGNLVIEIDDVRENEVVEVEIDASGTINEIGFS